ncbi:unnamed protein product [Cylicocyclus nassatus]|uniref:Uncharacterized protein n=1 Tax=Cylicocyclus nassatus TaxID=53992 RepID=A0AA36M8S2_CYLNA|nr:unnamed protein product [Cylicocyclus nassatus]
MGLIPWYILVTAHWSISLLVSTPSLASINATFDSMENSRLVVDQANFAVPLLLQRKFLNLHKKNLCLSSMHSYLE